MSPKLNANKFRKPPLGGSPPHYKLAVVYGENNQFSVTSLQVIIFSSAMASVVLLAITSFLMLLLQAASSHDYGVALTKSLLYFEAQRSGRLPSNQRVDWRGNSALTDGKEAGVDLVGGYYDAGDNIKFGFPMAFTVTMLAWSVVEFDKQLQAKNELSNSLEAIKWGTDYFLKAHPEPHVLYGQVGTGASDHECWERPEDMTTPRNVYRIDDDHPGSDLAGETAAAFASASIAFGKSNPEYSKKLIEHANKLFEFAEHSHDQYQNSIPDAGGFYPSSGFEDELVWAAAWIHKATNDKFYLDYIIRSNPGGARGSFSWDDKHVGTQVLIAKELLEGKFSEHKELDQYKNFAEQFICNCIGKGENNWKRTKGGLLWYDAFNNLQYATSSSFIVATYAKSLSITKKTLECPHGMVEHKELVTFVRSQVDYMLGSNPRKMSYMVGFGPKFPQRVHHRGASIVSIKKNATQGTCKGGFEDWGNRDAPNPNVIHGAIVGGPDLDDQFSDDRMNYKQNEAATANTAPLVGVLASLSS
ncbi:hypothetical protein ACH5RR_031666 [Cinchona calisaya]|uniref:Endoglucanase n=1 Tax=Cinchona calisaya TaxID=153742 RepID=A0ABD2YIQ5_9GENT